MRRTIVAAAMVALPAAVLALAGSAPRAAEGQVHELGSDTVRVHVEAGSAGFAPDTVRLRAGRPAEIVFTRTVASGCVAEVHIPGLGVPKTALPEGQPVAIRIMPQEAGAYEFLCGMNMRRGMIIVSDKP